MRILLATESVMRVSTLRLKHLFYSPLLKRSWSDWKKISRYMSCFINVGRHLCI